MKNTFLVTTILLGALAAACPNPADKAQKAAVGEKKAAVEEKPAGGEAAEAPPKGAALAIDAAKSKVEFIGSKVTGNHDGGFTGVSGTIHFVEGVVGSTAEITIDMTTVYSDADKLTGHLKSPDFFDVEKYPTAKFALNEMKSIGEDRYKVAGELTLHGVTKVITFDATITADDAAVTAKSEFSLNRKDFGIVYAGKPDDLIRDDVLLKLNVVAPKK